MSKQQRNAIFALRRAGWSRASIARQLNLRLIEIYRALAEGEDDGKAHSRSRQSRY